MYMRGYTADAIRTVINSIHGSHIGQQCLSCANIRSGLLSADVLFAGLKRHAKCPVPVFVHRHTDNTTRYLSFEVFRTGEIGRVRTTIPYRNTEALGIAHRHISTPLSGWGKQCQRQNIRCHTNKNSIGFRLFNERTIVAHTTLRIRILKQNAEGLVGKLSRFPVPNHQFDSVWNRSGSQNVYGLRENFVGYKELIGLFACFCALVLLMIEHIHGLRSSSAFVQQTGIGNRQSGQVSDHGLIVEKALQAPLGYLCLIGSVLCVPARIVENIPRNHRGRDGTVIAHANEVAHDSVIRRNFFQMTQVLKLTQYTLKIGETEWFFEPDRSGYSLFNQFIQAAHAQIVEHFLGFTRTGSDMPAFKAIRVHIFVCLTE